jgi:hypothetical protein
MAESPLQARDRDYFRENIGNVVTASQLVEDYRLRRVALSAFGLQDDLPNRAFIERVLGDGVAEPTACRTGCPTNATAPSPKRSASVGRCRQEPCRRASPTGSSRGSTGRNSSVRRGTGRGPAPCADGGSGIAGACRARPADTTAWLSVLGNPPLRRVFETALGLPASIGTLDLDRQIEEFRDAADRILGFSDISRFSEPRRPRKTGEELHAARAARLGSIADGAGPCGHHASAGKPLAQARISPARSLPPPMPRYPARLAKLSSIDPPSRGHEGVEIVPKRHRRVRRRIGARPRRARIAASVPPARSFPEAAAPG